MGEAAAANAARRPGGAASAVAGVRAADPVLLPAKAAVAPGGGVAGTPGDAARRGVGVSGDWVQKATHEALQEAVLGAVQQEEQRQGGRAKGGGVSGSCDQGAGDSVGGVASLFDGLGG